MAFRLGVLANVDYPEIGSVLEELEAGAEARGVELYRHAELRERVPGTDDDRRLEEAWDGLGCLLTLGGDGTLLRGARMAAPRGVAVLGCNLGRLGFLTTLAREELDEALERLGRGAFEEERRVALRVSVRRAGSEADEADPAGREPAVRGIEGDDAPGAGESVDVFGAGDGDSEGRERDGRETFFSVNDAVIHNSGFARLIRLRVRADREEVGQYSADGIVLSTATGSTAYSLSAGGPILVPTLEALVATPISPHTLAVRPVVFSSGTTVAVEVLSDHEDIVLTVDGQVGTRLRAGDRVEVERSEHPLRLVRWPGYSFFSVMRRKLRWGDVRPRTR